MPLTPLAFQPSLTRRLYAQDLHAAFGGLLHAAQCGAHHIPHGQHQAADEQHLSEALPWAEAGAQVKCVPCCRVGSAPQVFGIALAQLLIPEAAQQQSQNCCCAQQRCNASTRF